VRKRLSPAGKRWLASQAEEARAVILALVDKYVLGVLRRFGGAPQQFRATMTELQRRLYAEAA
jgi:hypothetical protein